MRTQKLLRGHSTKAERRFAELLKNAHIPFQTKVKINNKEIDFLIGKYAIEISGHQQDTDKNVMLARAGFIPLHFHNSDVNELLTNKIKSLWEK
jgi:very-short-patch-repair endonuclease